MNILKKIREILDDRGLLDADTKLDRDTVFAETGLDSLDLADLAMDCEDAFDITIDLENPPKTVGELIDIIKTQTGIEDEEDDDSEDDADAESNAQDGNEEDDDGDNA